MEQNSQKGKLYLVAIDAARLIPFAINKKHAKRQFGAALKAYQQAELFSWKAKGGLK